MNIERLQGIFSAIWGQFSDGNTLWFTLSSRSGVWVDKKRMDYNYARLCDAPLSSQGLPQYGHGFRRETFNPTSEDVAYRGLPDRDDVRLKPIGKPITQPPDKQEPPKKKERTKKLSKIRHDRLATSLSSSDEDIKYDRPVNRSCNKKDKKKYIRVDISDSFIHNKYNPPYSVYTELVDTAKI